MVLEGSGGGEVGYLHGAGVDEPLGRLEPDGAAYYLADTLGSILAVADRAGALTTGYTYGPFGQNASSGASIPNPFKFTGREADTTDFHYYRARYYHSALNRFVSEDPLGVSPGNANFYAYVANNPTNLTDPLGLLFGGRIDAGEQYGDYALDYYAAILTDPTAEWYKRIPAYAGGLFAALWGRKTSDETLFTLASSGSSAIGLRAARLARAGSSILKQASEAAFKAGRNINDFVVPLKHLPGSAGRWSKFARGVNPHQVIREALVSPNARFLPNPNNAGAFRVVTDLGRAVGTKGETAVRVVVDWAGKIWTAFPVK